PSLGVGQPQTLLNQILGCPMFRKAGPVVSNLNTKRPILLFRFNFEQARRGAGSYSVANSVFDDWLEDEVGYFGLQTFRTDLDASNEAILKTDAFNFEITTEKIDLLLQCDLGRARVFEGQPKKIAEA